MFLRADMVYPQLILFTSQVNVVIQPIGYTIYINEKFAKLVDGVFVIWCIGGMNACRENYRFP